MPPSPRHQAIVHLFRDRPTMLAALGILPDAASEPMNVVDSDLSEVAPVERRADLVLLVGEPVCMAIALEVQLSKKPKKRYTWPAYAANLASRHSCPSSVVVVTPKPEVARWAAKPTAFALDSGHFQPRVIGPSLIPLVTQPEQAHTAPELAILSAMAHGNSEAGRAVLRAMFFALDALPFEDADIYYEVVCEALSPARQSEVEAVMSENLRQHPFSMKRRSQIFQDAHQEGLEQGLEQGIEQGLEKGLEQGIERGLEQGLQRGLLLGRQEGRHEGQREYAIRAVLRRFARQFGMPGADLQSRIQDLPLERLEALDDAMTSFLRVEEVEGWLGAS